MWASMIANNLSSQGFQLKFFREKQRTHNVRMVTLSRKNVKRNLLKNVVLPGKLPPVILQIHYLIGSLTNFQSLGMNQFRAASEVWGLLVFEPSSGLQNAERTEPLNLGILILFRGAFKLKLIARPFQPIKSLNPTF